MVAHDDADDEFLSLFHFAGVHHARFIDPDVPLHVVTRVYQGRHLLRPCAELNAIVAGVVGRAQFLYREVRLYALAFLSNHAHFMLQGPPSEVPAFIGFIKREVSRRWGQSSRVNWPGSMWGRYKCSALPTAESQELCLKYILSQGTKEGLVARPQDWPGVHCARALLDGQPLTGAWTNHTGWSRACDSERRKTSPQQIRKSDYRINYEVRFETIPAWASYNAETRTRALRRLANEIEAEARATRGGRTCLGAAKVRRVPLDRRTELPTQPWFTRRRRLICWAAQAAPETQAYLARYWQFQASYRAAKEAARAGIGGVSYPVGSFVPGRLRSEPDAMPVAA